MYIVKRTQIYLNADQGRRLDERAAAAGRTRSALIREAIDALLDGPTADRDEMAAFRAAVEGAFGTAPDLPSGADYVRALRTSDSERQRALERRRQA
jgi:predicted DNA-binding protein